MDLTNIRTFLQVVDSGSYAKAAEELQYAQSTVSFQIQAFEKELGFSLFERIGRKNHLTPAGIEFLQYANELQYTLQKISDIGFQSDQIAFSLRIGVLQSLLFNSLLKTIPLIQEKYPNAVITVKVANAAELLELLAQNHLDIIYISGPLNSDPSLERLFTKREQMVFVSGSGHPLAGRRKIPLEDILQYPFILTETTGQSYYTFHNLISGTGLDPKCQLMVNDITAISVFLRNNKLLSFLPRPAISDILHTDDIVALDVDVPPQIYYRQILVRKNTWISPAIDQFVHTIQQSIPANS